MRLVPLCVLIIMVCNVPATAQISDFCAGMPRAENAGLERIPASTDWFDVYELVPGVYSIHEPHQWQEIISYLILGDDRSLLFDTGNGMGDIRALVETLTDKPVVVVNSHSHTDHIGGNWQFDEIVAIDTEYGRGHTRGTDHAAVADEVSAEALCRPLPAGVDADTYRIRPYTVTRWVDSGHKIDIGGHVLEIVHTPGHAPDSVVLIDRARGYIWTGDTYHPRDMWLFAEDTDYAAYRKAIHFLADLAPDLKQVFPAHNVLVDWPVNLIAARDAFDRIVAGELEGEYDEELDTLLYTFEKFSMRLRADHPKNWQP